MLSESPDAFDPTILSCDPTLLSCLFYPLSNLFRTPKRRLAAGVSDQRSDGAFGVRLNAEFPAQRLGRGKMLRRFRSSAAKQKIAQVVPRLHEFRAHSEFLGKRRRVAQIRFGAAAIEFAAAFAGDDPEQSQCIGGKRPIT